MLKHPLVWLIVLMGTLLAFAATTLLQRRSDSMYKHTRDLPEILHLISQAYVDEIDPVDLMPGAFQGVLSSIDQNASYIPPGVEPVSYADKVYKKFGFSLARNNGYGYVLGVAPDGPAGKAGLKPGAYVYKIGNEPIRLQSRFRMLQLLAEGRANLSLTVVQPDEADEEVITLKAGRFQPPQIQYTAIDAGLHMIGIPEFYKGMERDLKAALQKVDEAGARLILDLRNNPRGSERDLQTLAALFLNKGSMGAWVDAAQKETVIMNPVEGRPLKKDGFFILINTGTSLAAETFSAAAQDGDKATVVGRKSLGIPRFYQTIPLKSGGYVQLPSHKLVLPSGKELTLKGIEPDLEVKNTRSGEDEGDAFLEKALELIRKTQLAKAG
ncbi:MAG: S41 family peptidase [Acidobacteriota bacterium]|nr:S41 family peptidase [Acidobacteriota bacterium]